MVALAPSRERRRTLDGDLYAAPGCPGARRTARANLICRCDQVLADGPWRAHEGVTHVRHTDYLQFDAKPEKPDPVYAHKLQELIGGAYGEMTVTMPYLFQGWNCRMPGKYKELQADGLETTVAPNALFDEEYAEAAGPQPDGMHEFGYLLDPEPLGGPGSAPKTGLAGKIKDALT